MLMAANNVPLHSFALKADLWFRQHRLAHCFCRDSQGTARPLSRQKLPYRPVQDFRDRSGVPSKTTCGTPASRGLSSQVHRVTAGPNAEMRHAENFPTRAGAARPEINKGD